ncbi:MAG: hypothetical protein ACD_73C00273G0002 [uncultured bacterium]|nr:MAG: hypothetical protein ACD_73C00273G0002 [uncultured bacterium]
MKNTLDINKPSEAEVYHYLKQWEDSPAHYNLQESSLSKLFTKTYPLNNNLDDVLIKVCALNTIYSTNIYSPFTVAQHIVRLEIDIGIEQNDLALVNKIAKVEMNGGKIKNFYSFATKYCSHHKPMVYPIYDSYVDQMLVHCKNKDNFDDFSKGDLKIFVEYRRILENFSKHYSLERFNLKEIDQYLWLAGKEYFPKTYGPKMQK